MRSSFRKSVLLLVLATVSFLILALLICLGRYSTTLIHIMSYTMPISSLQGIIQSLFLLMCILMVFVDYEYGRRISEIIIGISCFSNTMGMLHTHDLASLPGLGTTIISLTAIEIIAFFYKRNSENSITDFITGLRNRRFFVSEIEKKIEEIKPFYLAYFEINELRSINDSFGLQTGDFIIKMVAGNMKDSIGSKDVLFRMGGSNFSIIFDGGSNPIDNVRKIIENSAKQISISNTKNDSFATKKTCTISLVAGLAKFPDDAENSTSLLKQADIALTHARKDPSGVCMFSKDMEDEQIKQFEIERIIKDALSKGFFHLVYQPQYKIEGKKIRGFETLLRLRTAEGKNVSPADFIPVAEKSDLIMRIDEYVLRQALSEFKETLERCGNMITLSVNISAKSISMPDYAQRVKSLLKEINFPAYCLELEITEYSFAESLDNTIKNITDLRNLGVKIALDDFGTGYTSIAQLMNLPINLLKIDKSLINDIEINQMNRDLVDSVIYMGHIMNCEVISEGVETEEQLLLLDRHKCDYIQGFVWGKPMPLAEAAMLIG